MKKIIWSEAEIELLSNFDINNINELQSKLNRSKLAILKKAESLGLYKRKTIKKNVKNTLEYILQERTDYTLIEQNGERIKLKHSCGNEYETYIYSFINGHGCPNKECVKTKKENTFMNKYNSKYPYENEEIKNKMINKKKNNYFINRINTLSVIPLFNINEFTGSKLDYKWKCKTCGHEFIDSLKNGTFPICRKCYPISKNSIPEMEMKEFIKSLDSNYEENKTFFINGIRKEADIYLPNKNIIFEMNGNYYHSELNGKDKNYHINKLKFFNDLYIQVINIFESEWITKKEIVKSIIKSKLGLNERIFARKCEIRTVDSKTSSEFLDANHIQGSINSSVKLGLYYNNKLVSLITFSKSRFNKQYEWELLRFCNNKGINVIGGASKLFSYFIKNYNPKSVISYADKRYSNGNLYTQIGFTKINDSEPNYYYINRKNYLYLKSRIQFQKHKLKNLLTVYDEKLNEWENMQLNGYDRIWDCGNYVFVFNPLKTHSNVQL